MAKNFSQEPRVSDSVDTLDRSPAETRIRALALQMASASNRVLADGDCDRIVAAACGQLTAEQLRTGQLGSDILSRVADMTQKALEVGPVNYLSGTQSTVDARARQDGTEGRLVNGQWVAMTKRADSVDSARTSYQTLALNDTRSLQGVTAQNFASSPFAIAGLDFGTFAYLRAQGSFSAQNILNASGDAKALGFKTNDRAAMLDHSIIDRFDPKARHTNKALQDYQQRVEGDEDLADLHLQRKHAKTPVQRKALDAQITERRARHAEESGLKGRIDDPNGHPKAVKATKRRKTAVEKKAEAQYGPKQAATPTGSAPRTKSRTDLFKQLTGPSPN